MFSGKKRKTCKLFLLTILITALGLFFYFTFFKAKFPNIILITIDALRSDHLSCYGYERLTTPNIDRLAKEGVIFSEAIAPSTDTFHSIPAIMTSTYPHYYGVEGWYSSSVNPLAHRLAEILSDHGYYTALFSNGHPILMIKGIEQDFEKFAVDGNKDFTADRLTSDLLKWMRSNNKRKFFLWVHYFDPHSPYSPPEPYKSAYATDRFNVSDKDLPVASEDENNPLTKYNLIPYHVAENGITSVNYYISQYDGEIRFVDEQIGLLFSKLEELDLDKNTLIIITADHGESLGEHDIYFQHGGIPYDTLLLVPLIFKYDNLISKGMIIENQVSCVDIFPTVLDILNIKRPAGIEGKSFLDLMQGRSKNHTRYTFSNSHAPIYSMRTKKWKLISFDDSDKYYLFDLENDKGELNDVKDVRKEEFKFLKQELDKWIEKNRPMTISESESFLDSETLEKLRSLGYLQ